EGGGPRVHWRLGVEPRLGVPQPSRPGAVGAGWINRDGSSRRTAVATLALPARCLRRLPFQARISARAPWPLLICPRGARLGYREPGEMAPAPARGPGGHGMR